jgi:hypothetical protein
MNRDHTLWHLGEAHEELQRTIDSLRADESYGLPELGVAMQHMYHHLNTALNARNEPAQRTAESSKEDFVRWRQFPRDIPMD